MRLGLFAGTNGRFTGKWNRIAGTTGLRAPVSVGLRQMSMYASWHRAIEVMCEVGCLGQKALGSLYVTQTRLYSRHAKEKCWFNIWFIFDLSRALPFKLSKLCSLVCLSGCLFTYNFSDAINHYIRGIVGYVVYTSNIYGRCVLANPTLFFPILSFTPLHMHNTNTPSLLF